MPGILNRKSRWAIWWLHATKVGQWTIVIAFGYVVLRSVLCRFLDQFGQAEQRLFSIAPTNFVRRPARVGRESNRRLLGGAAFCDHAIFSGWLLGIRAKSAHLAHCHGDDLHRVSYCLRVFWSAWIPLLIAGGGGIHGCRLAANGAVSGVQKGVSV